MGDDDRVMELLHGPRGRRLCLNVLESEGSQGWTPFFLLAEQPSTSAQLDELTRLLSNTDLAAIATSTQLFSLLAPLARTVDRAMYWQEPDHTDRVLAQPEFRSALQQVAAAISDSPAAAWWSSPLDLADQRYVEWLDDPQFGAPNLTGATQKLESWRTATLADEHEAQKRPTDVAAPWSGSWWSTPALSRLPITTRSLPDLGAAQLALFEDRMGWSNARVWPVKTAVGCRVYEIDGPDTWSALVSRYPLDVTLSRMHDWWRTTGREARWLIPDWRAVAADYDAVHLSVTGYLTTAGRALPVEESASFHTVLAGWSPDETYWLADVLQLAGATSEWQNSQVNRGESAEGWSLLTTT